MGGPDGVPPPDPVPLFERTFGHAPALVVRAPGRVNLIGEHIDYNGLAVLPIAIQRAVRIAARPRDDTTVRLVNHDPAFRARPFRVSPRVRPSRPGDWTNYVKATVQTLALERGLGAGADLAIASDLPAAAGLSSSSALVVASGLAVAAVHGLPVDPLAMAELMARAERYVGTSGGGMDQAICLCARPGHACRIDFDPLAVTPVRLPAEWRFVVASSLVPAEKSGAVQAAYNHRTRECADALALVRTAIGEPPGTEYRELLARRPPGALLETGARVLPDPLSARFRHVVTEAGRVSAAVDAIRTGDRQAFGRLLTESHASLRDDYEVGSEALDRLVEIARGAGAVGARLTGAGFGGSVVALASDEGVARVVRELGERYFVPAGLPAGEGAHLFVAEASAGASVDVRELR